MGDVTRNVSDMSLSTSPDARRVLYVHFTNPMWYSSITFTTLKPGNVYSWTTIFTAFVPIVWTLVFCSIIIACVLIYTIESHCEFDLDSSSTKNKEQSNALNMTYLGMDLFGYIVGQDAPTPPKYLSSKCIYIIWLYYGLVIGAAYACSLQALIVSPGVEYIPRTFAELVKLHEYEWGAASGFRDGLGEQVFRNSDNPVMRRIYHKMEAVPEEVACIAKTAAKKYACFNWDLMQRFRFQTTFVFKSGTNHPFQQSTDTAFFTSLNFITRKREIFRSHFNNFFKLAFDTGLVKQTIIMDWNGYRMTVIKAMQEGQASGIIHISTIDGPIPFGLNIVKGSFIILLIGLAISIISFVFEHATIKIFKAKKLFRIRFLK